MRCLRCWTSLEQNGSNSTVELQSVPSALAFPGGKRGFYQTGIEVAGVTGYLFTDPFRHVKLLVFELQFNLSNHQPLVVAEKFINLPDKAAVADGMAVFLDQRFLSQPIEHLIRILNGDLILEFHAGGAAARSLDRQKPIFPGNSHPDRHS